METQKIARHGGAVLVVLCALLAACGHTPYQEAAPAVALTTAELRTLRYLPSHLSFREIAAETFVTMNTVKTHAHSVYRKLDVRSRSQAVAAAVREGLI